MAPPMSRAAASHDRIKYHKRLLLGWLCCANIHLYVIAEKTGGGGGGGWVESRSSGDITWVAEIACLAKDKVKKD